MRFGAACEAELIGRAGALDGAQLGGILHHIRAAGCGAPLELLVVVDEREVELRLVAREESLVLRLRLRRVRRREQKLDALQAENLLALVTLTDAERQRGDERHIRQ